MKRFAKVILVVVVVLAVVLAAFVLVKKKKEELAKLPPPEKPFVPVRVAEIEKGTLSVTEHYLGEIEPVVFSRISSKVSGILFDVKKFEGDKVRRGELIALLDAREIEAQIRSVKAKISAAKTEYVVKKRILERNRILFKNKALSQEAWELSQLDFERAKANLASLKDELSALKAQLSYARISAPFDGVVSKRFKNPGDFVVPGTPILELEEVKAGYKVLVGIPQEKAARIRKGEEVILTSSGERLAAKVFRVYPAVSNDGLAQLEVRLSKKPFGLPTGSKIGVDVVLKKVSGFILPLDAIFETQNETWVFAVKENGKAQPEVEAVKVKVLGRDKDRVAVSGPLSDYESVVVAGEATFLRIYSGAKVKVVGVKK